MSVDKRWVVYTVGIDLLWRSHTNDNQESL